MNMLRRHGRARWPAALIIASAVGAVAGAGLFATPALADPARARAHFNLAKRYFEVDEYVKAIEEFKAAHVEEPDPAFLYNIAECYRHMGETKEALVFYRRFLLLSPPNAPTRASVEKRVAALQAAMRGAADVPLAPTTSAAGAARRPRPRRRSRPRRPLPRRPPQRRPNRRPPPRRSRSRWPRRRPRPPRPWICARRRAPRPTPTPRARSTRAPGSTSSLGGALVAGTAGAFVLASGKGGSPPSTPLGNQPAFQ